MILHILKKDLRLLWPMVIGVAAIHGVNAALWLDLGPFQEPVSLRLIANIFPFAAYLAMFILVVSTIQQDVLLGDRQDWIVRPINRIHLLVAKFLFVVVFIHAPLFLVDFSECLIAGFNPSNAAAGALTRAYTLVTTLTLPAMVIASVTASVVEAIIAVGVVVASYVLYLGVIQGSPIGPAPMTMWGPIWMMAALWMMLSLCGAAALLPVQFLRRKTVAVRIALGALIVVGFAVLLTPWKATFAVQEAFAKDPSVGVAVTVAFDAEAGKMSRKIPPPSPDTAYLPLRVAGLPAHASLVVDRQQVRILNARGEVVYDDFRAFPKGQDRFAEMREKDGQAEARGYQPVTLPAKLYARIKDEQLRLEIDEAFTVLQQTSTETMPALDGTATFARVPWQCSTQIDDDGDEVQAGCETIGTMPSCVSAILENPGVGKNSERHACLPDYTPFPMRFHPDAMTHFALSLPFADPYGHTVFTVDRRQLPASRVVFTMFEPVDHFRRNLVIPDIRLSDWLPE